MADKAQCLRVLGELNTLKMIGALDKDEFTELTLLLRKGMLQEGFLSVVKKRLATISRNKKESQPQFAKSVEQVAEGIAVH